MTQITTPGLQLAPLCTGHAAAMFPFGSSGPESGPVFIDAFMFCDAADQRIEPMLIALQSAKRGVA